MSRTGRTPQQQPPLSRRAAIMAGGAGGLALAGCSRLPWLGEAEEPKLSGERRSVLLIEEDVRADPELASFQVRLQAPRRNPDWPQAGGNATHAMYHLEAAATIRPAWRAGIGEGTGRRSRLLAPPVVAGGRVFTVDAADEVRAFEASGGRQVWRQRLSEGRSGERALVGGLGFEGGRLYVAAGSGTVRALDAGSGREVWRKTIKAPVRSAPTIAEGRLLVLTADSQLYALDGRSGETQWRHAGVFEQAGILGGASPAASGGIVVAAYASGEVFGLEIASGRPLWSDTVLRPRRTLAIGTISDIIGDPVIDRDRVLVAGVSGEMVALDLARGDRIWAGNVTSTQMPWAAGEVVYLLTERNELVCMLRRDGRVRWVSPLDRAGGGAKAPNAERVRWSGPVLVTDRLVVASSAGAIASVSPYTGELLGEAKLPGPVSLAPIVADGTVYLLTDEGELVAYR